VPLLPTFKKQGTVVVQVAFALSAGIEWAPDVTSDFRAPAESREIMSSSGRLPVVIISCQVLQDMLERLLPEGLAEQVTFMDYGLHREPKKMPRTLQEMIDGIESPSLIVFGYGLCGNGLNGVKAGKHTLLIPRVHDCIAILLGSHQAYTREFESEPGTYYLSKGWLESGSHPLEEYQRLREKYGPEDAEWLMDQQYQHYDRLALVTHNQQDLERYRSEAKEVADYCSQWGIRYTEIVGSDEYVRRLIQMAAAPEAAETDDDFLVIAPGGEVSQDHFMR
jgi:hypothetical protein